MVKVEAFRHNLERSERGREDAAWVGEARTTGSWNQRRVLRGYRRVGKAVHSAALQRMRLTETEWMDDRVPELVWIALLIHVLGVKEGTAVAVSIDSRVRTV